MASSNNAWGLTAANGVALGDGASTLLQMAANTSDDGFHFSVISGGGAVKLQNIAEPGSSSDAATKSYVDSVAQGLHAKDSAYVSTQGTTSLAQLGSGASEPTGGVITIETGASGGDITYNGTTLTIDSVDFTSAEVGTDTIILVRHDVGTTNPSYNQGLYYLSACGSSAAATLTRIAAMNADAEVPGAYSLVTHGTDAGNGFVVTSPDSVDSFTINSTAIAWTTFSSAGGGFTVAGAGLTDDGSTVNAVGTADRITVGANSIDIASSYVGQASITTLGTIGTGTWQGTAVADAYVANALTIDSGTVNNSVIGGTGAAAGTFTTLEGTVVTGTTSVGYLAADAAGSILLNTNGIVFEGATANGFETTLSVTDPTADRAITFPDAAGTVCTTAQSDGSLANAVFSSGFSGSSDNAVSLNSSDSTPNEITAGETLFFVGANGDIHRIGNISAASGTDFTMDSFDAVDASYTLIVVKNDSGAYTAQSFAITSTSGTTLSTTGNHGFSVGATANTGFLFSTGGPPITLRDTTNAKLVVTGTVAASATVITGTVTNTGLIQTNDYILGNNLYTLAPDAVTSSYVRYAATVATFDGSVAQTVSIDYDNMTIGLNSSNSKLEVKDNGISNTKLSGNIENNKLANSTISGVSLGSDLNALTLGDGLSVGTEGFSVTNGQGTVSYGEYKRIFFAQAGTTLVWVATVVSVVADGPGGSADVVTVGDYANGDITTSHYVVFLREDADANWSLIEGGASNSISAVDDAANTFTVDNANNLNTNATEVIAFIFDGPTMVDGTIYAQVSNATQTTSQVAATVTGTIPAGSTVLNTQIQNATDGQPSTVATVNARTYGTYYGQAAMTLDMAFADAENIVDDSSNELLGFGVTSSATNYLKITNAAASGAPLMETVGSSDTNIDMELKVTSDDNATGTATFNFTKSGTGGSVELDINDLLAGNTRTLAFTDGASSTITFPAGNLTLATVTGTETLTNKTLTAPTVTTSMAFDDNAGTIGSSSTAALLTLGNGLLTIGGDVTLAANENLTLQGTGDIIINDGRYIGTALDTDMMQLDDNSSDPTVTISGKLVATGGVSSSDIKLKKNIEDCGGLELIRELRGVRWDWKKTDKPSMGVIAQEVQPWLDDIVSEEKNGLGVQYNGLVGVLINAVNDLNLKVDLIAKGKSDEALKVKAASPAPLTPAAKKKHGTKRGTKKEKKQGDASSSSESEGETPKSTSRYNFRRRGRGQHKACSD